VFVRASLITAPGRSARRYIQKIRKTRKIRKIHKLRIS